MDAVVAASTVLFGVPLMLVADPVSTIEAPSTSSGDAFRNVKRRQAAEIPAADIGHQYVDAAGLDRHAVVQAIQLVRLVSAGYSELGLPFMQYHMPT